MSTSDVNINFDYLINYIRDSCDYLNTDLYYTNLHQAFDNYRIYYDYSMKAFVESYGVFRGIKLYEAAFGKFTIDNNNLKNYDILGYVIISDLFNKRYPTFELFLNAINEY